MYIYSWDKCCTDCQTTMGWRWRCQQPGELIRKGLSVTGWGCWLSVSQSYWLSAHLLAKTMRGAHLGSRPARPDCAGATDAELKMRGERRENRQWRERFEKIYLSPVSPVTRQPVSPATTRCSSHLFSSEFLFSAERFSGISCHNNTAAPLIISLPVSYYL